MTSDPRRPDTPFWVEPASVEGDTLRLSAKESHHLLHVLRAALGTPFEAVDGAGLLYECALAGVEHRLAVGRIIARSEEAGELPGTLQLIVGLPDFASTEALVARAVPLGVHAIELVETERGGGWRATEARRERLLRLARASVKQSRRTRLPHIRFPGRLESLLEANGRGAAGSRFLADSRGRFWSQDAPAGVLSHVTLAVGPPGGFSDGERARLGDLGYEAISLGMNRLRTEDAACVILVLARERILAGAGWRH